MNLLPPPLVSATLNPALRCTVAITADTACMTHPAYPVPSRGRDGRWSGAAVCEAHNTPTHRAQALTRQETP